MLLLYNLTEELPQGDFTCALDQADLVQEGSDVTIPRIPGCAITA